MAESRKKIERHCGFKVKGGYYLESNPPKDLEDPKFMFLVPGPQWNVAPRTIEMMTMDEFDSIFNIRLPGQNLLLDHVGKSHYTPIGFASEAHLHGASRKVNPWALPPKLALPIVVVFTHPWGCVYHEESFLESFSYSALLEDTDNVYTLSEEDSDWWTTWGDTPPVFTKEYINRSWTHPRIELFRLLDNALKHRGAFGKLVKENSLCMTEAIFGAAILERRTYVLKDDEEIPPPEAIVLGYEGIRIEE